MHPTVLEYLTHARIGDFAARPAGLVRSRKVR